MNIVALADRHGPFQVVLSRVYLQLQSCGSEPRSAGLGDTALEMGRAGLLIQYSHTESSTLGNVSCYPVADPALVENSQIVIRGSYTCHSGITFRGFHYHLHTLK